MKKKFTPVAQDHESFIWVRDQIAEALRTQFPERISDPDWVENKIKLVWAVGQQIAGRSGLTRPSFEQVRIADQQAAGHVDWLQKFCLYVAEIIVYGKRSGPL